MGLVQALPFFHGGAWAEGGFSCEKKGASGVRERGLQVLSTNLIHELALYRRCHSLMVARGRKGASGVEHKPDP